VTFTCWYGTIQLSGTTVCHDAEPTEDICDTQTCRFSLVVTPDLGYFFSSRSPTGLKVSCDSCASTTLTVSVPNPADVYSGSLTMNTGFSEQLSVTVATYENWGSHWVSGTVEACGMGGCQNATNGQVLSLWLNNPYELTALTCAHCTEWGWHTNAGTLSNSTNNPTYFTPTDSGGLSLIVRDEAVGWNWAGYVFSPASSSGSVNNVSGEFVLPLSTSTPFAVWIGIGGVGTGGQYANLWQAGVVFNASGSPQVSAWYENFSSSHGKPVWNSSFPVRHGDKLQVTLSYSSGTSTFRLKDLTAPGQPTWSGSIPFQPDTKTAEWVLEPKGSGATPGIPFSSITVNGALSLLSSFISFDSYVKGQVEDCYCSYLNTGSTNFWAEPA